MPTPESSLSNEKLAAELEKLKLENQQLQRPQWRNAAFLIAAGTLVASLIANFTQYRTSQNNLSDARRQFETRWKTEKEELEQKIVALTQKNEMTAEVRQQVRSELYSVNRDIKGLEALIFEDEQQLKSEQFELDTYVQEKRNDKAFAAQKIVEITKDSIKSRTAQRDALVSHRSELEKRLGNAQ